MLEQGYAFEQSHPFTRLNIIAQDSSLLHPRIKCSYRLITKLRGFATPCSKPWRIDDYMSLLTLGDSLFLMFVLVACADCGFPVLVTQPMLHSIHVYCIVLHFVVTKLLYNVI